MSTKKKPKAQKGTYDPNNQFNLRTMAPVSDPFANLSPLAKAILPLYLPPDSTKKTIWQTMTGSCQSN